MIAELLHVGPMGALTGRYIAGLLDITLRDVEIQIERERAGGAPICASCGHIPGYYLAPDKQCMIEYCRRLEHREHAIENTKKNCLKTVEKLPDRKDRALHL